MSLIYLYVHFIKHYNEGYKILVSVPKNVDY